MVAKVCTISLAFYDLPHNLLILIEATHIEPLKQCILRKMLKARYLLRFTCTYAMLFQYTLNNSDLQK